MNGCIIPGTSIAVDYWQVQRHPGLKLFFLTHLHGDHVVGLTSSWRHPIYCSPITAQLLAERFGVQHSVLRALTVGQSHLIRYCQGHHSHSAAACVQDQTSMGSGQQKAGMEKHACCELLSVTVIGANHCPGAVMFLFDGPFGKVLHTGDFRFSEGMFEEGSPLSQHVGTIDRIYLDNTYCSPECVFPTREEALQTIIDVVKSHNDYDIVFGVRGLGKEELLAAVALAVEEWINVPPTTLSFAKSLGLPSVFQTGHPDSRLRVVPFHHVSRDYVHQLNSKTPTIVILPTALYRGVSGKPYANIPEVYVIPYSDHSSYPELHQFVSKLRPAFVKPIVHGKVRGPFGVDFSSRQDMSCFQKYLTKPRQSQLSTASPEDPMNQNIGMCGFEDMFPDFQKPLLKRRKSVKNAPRKVLCPKGVNYMSDDEMEIWVSPQRSKQTKKSRVCTKNSLLPSAQASNNQNGQKKPKQNMGPKNSDKDVHGAALASQRKAADIRDRTDENTCHEDLQCTVSQVEGERSSPPPNHVPAKRTAEISVKVSEPTPLLCESRRKADDTVDCPGSELHACPHSRDAAVCYACRFSGLLTQMHENRPPSNAIQRMLAHKERKLCKEKENTAPLASSSTASEEPPREMRAASENIVKRPALKAQSVRGERFCIRTAIQNYLVYRYGGESAVSGSVQRAKLMDTYNKVIGTRHSVKNRVRVLELQQKLLKRKNTEVAELC
ncbi:uncharacterized protein LOC143285070 [Babylonia areolata]|uniref:uncharacterized protein LOC143285070 n=1 Tax=Babylonia areolata TaxID=304850 RepID=UPI003FD4A1F2